MSTNHDLFENELRALQRRELPAEWRNEILGAATTPAALRLPRAPRWLVAGWSVAWAAILVMWLTTPGEPPAQSSASALPSALPLRWDERNAVITALLAAN